jgi:uncharacterized membrane protein HdeD (DUF308 family)
MLMDKAEVGFAQDGLVQKWGWVVARGVIAVLFGLIAFSRPGPMAFGMVLLFGCFAFAAGIATVIAAARSGRAGSNWGALLVEGLLSIAIGVLAVLWPASTALAFVWLIGAWALLSGALEIAAAVRLRKVIEKEWVLGIAGALSIAFGLLMFYRPLAGGIAVVWWLGAYALVSGVMMIVLGFRLRSYARTHRSELPAEGLHQRV